MQKPCINLDDVRLLRSYDKIGSAIVDYINDMGITWEIEVAKKVYFGKYIYIIDENDSGFNYKPFIQWLIFSYKLRNGSSLIECIYDKYIDKIPGYEKNTLLNLRKTWEGLYKVYGNEDDKILVKDIFTGEKMYLWNSFLSEGVKRYSGIFTRTMYMNNKIIPLPGYSVMTNSFLKDMEQYVVERFTQICKYRKVASVKDFINSNSLLLHRYLLYYSL